MARPPKNLRHYLGLPADPSHHPYYNRWKPRRAVIEAEVRTASAGQLDGRQTAMPLDDTDTPQDGETLALPEPPPPQPGDDLRLPNPERWAPEQAPLPRWFWGVAVLMAIGLGLTIARTSSGPRTSLNPSPEFSQEPSQSSGPQTAPL